MKTTLLAATAALLVAGTAKADLTGTSFTLDVDHNGLGGMTVDVAPPTLMTYGTPQVFNAPLIGMWTAITGGPVTTPGATGFDNSLELNFSTLSSYQLFANDPQGIATVANLSENVLAGSVEVYVDDSFVGLGTVSGSGNGFDASWTPATVWNSGDKSVLIVWNSVPAPGAIAFLGLAGLTNRRRRRRA